MQTYFAKIRDFVAFRRKHIEFSMEANFQRKITIIRDAYCFQLGKLSNDNLTLNFRAKNRCVR